MIHVTDAAGRTLSLGTTADVVDLLKVRAVTVRNWHRRPNLYHFPEVHSTHLAPNGLYAKHWDLAEVREWYLANEEMLIARGQGSRQRPGMVP